MPTGHRTTGHAAPGPPSSGHSSMGHSSSGDGSSGHGSAGHGSSGHSSAGHGSSGHASPGHSSAHASSGQAHRQRLAIATPLVQHRAEVSDLIGRIDLPGRALMTLMAGTVVLALTILSLLIFVGRRPDPRIAASRSRLRNSANW